MYSSRTKNILSPHTAVLGDILLLKPFNSNNLNASKNLQNKNEHFRDSLIEACRSLTEYKNIWVHNGKNRLWSLEFIGWSAFLLTRTNADEGFNLHSLWYFFCTHKYDARKRCDSEATAECLSSTMCSPLSRQPKPQCRVEHTEEEVGDGWGVRKGVKSEVLLSKNEHLHFAQWSLKFWVVKYTFHLCWSCSLFSFTMRGQNRVLFNFLWDLTVIYFRLIDT